MSRSVRFTRQARREIRAVLAGMEHAAARRALRSAIAAAARRLAIYPLLGRSAPSYVPEPYRFWLLPRFSHVLVYEPRPDAVVVLRFVDARRDLPRLLAGLADAPSPPEPDESNAPVPDEPA